MGKLTFNEIKVDGYERVVEVKQEEAGLHAIIAIQNTKMGPALGGIRAFPYATFDDALTDALRLAQGMTYKAAISETGTGGGKSVIITDYKKPKSEKLLLAFAEAVNHFEGQYICAEDFGMHVSDLEKIRKGTRYAVGLPHPKSSGDPSPFTAYGGFMGVKAVAHQLWETDALRGRTVAIQGLGSVGMRLAEHLFWSGAKLIVSDINEAAVDRAVRQFGAQAVEPEAIFDAECDIFAPCALGGILNPDTIPRLKCKAVAGLANNQLLTDADGEALMNRGILYAPDFVINSGGLLDVCCEIGKEGYNPQTARHAVARIYNLLVTIFTLSEEEKLSTSEVAINIAEHNLEKAIGKRTEEVIFHH